MLGVDVRYRGSRPACTPQYVMLPPRSTSCPLPPRGTSCSRSTSLLVGGEEVFASGDRWEGFDSVPAILGTRGWTGDLDWGNFIEVAEQLSKGLVVSVHQPVCEFLVARTFGVESPRYCEMVGPVSFRGHALAIVHAVHTLTCENLVYASSRTREPHSPAVRHASSRSRTRRPRTAALAAHSPQPHSPYSPDSRRRRNRIPFPLVLAAFVLIHPHQQRFLVFGIFER